MDFDALAAIVRESLGVEDVCPDTSLHELGCDSLDGLDLFYRLQDRHGVVAVPDNYRHLNLSDLAKELPACPPSPP